MPSRPSLLDAAEARWAQIRLERPEAAAALPLHQALLTRQIRVLEALPEGAWAATGTDREAALASLSGGRPAVAGTQEPPGLSSCARNLAGFASDLAAGGAGPAAAKVATAVASGTVDKAALLHASWHRQPDRMNDVTRKAGLNLQVAWLIAELATAPLAVRRHEAMLGANDALREAVAQWNQGHCPACGAWPVMAEYFLGDRLNRCAYCAAAWPLSTLRCTYCGESGPDFRTIVAHRERPGRRLELCRACGGYLKTIDVGRPTPFPLLAIEDLASQDLDGAAMHHGFRRTGLKRG